MGSGFVDVAPAVRARRIDAHVADRSGSLELSPVRVLLRLIARRVNDIAAAVSVLPRTEHVGHEGLVLDTVRVDEDDAIAYLRFLFHSRCSLSAAALPRRAGDVFQET